MIGAALTWGRAQAEARMTETFTFFTLGDEVEDPVTHQPSFPEVVVGSTRGRFKATSTQPTDKSIGGQNPAVDRPEVHVPVGSVFVGEGVHVRCTASTADASLVGRVFITRFAPSSGQVTAWRYPVEADS